jgi:hypothetical protein
MASNLNQSFFAWSFMKGASSTRRVRLVLT